MTTEEILKKEDIQEYETPIWKMSQTQLKNEFSSEASNKPVATKIIKNIIWQVYTWIQSSKHEPIKGNLRSFWYLRVKAPLGKVGLLDDPTDHSETMSKLFSELSRDYKLFKYIDFG